MTTKFYFPLKVAASCFLLLFYFVVQETSSGGSRGAVHLIPVEIYSNFERKTEISHTCLGRVSLPCCIYSSSRALSRAPGRDLVLEGGGCYIIEECSYMLHLFCRSIHVARGCCPASLNYCGPPARRLRCSHETHSEQRATPLLLMRSNFLNLRRLWHLSHLGKQTCPFCGSVEFLCSPPFTSLRPPPFGAVGHSYGYYEAEKSNGEHLGIAAS